MNFLKNSQMSQRAGLSPYPGVPPVLLLPCPCTGSWVPVPLGKLSPPFICRAGYGEWESWGILSPYFHFDLYVYI